MEVSEAKRLRALEEENRQLKAMVAERALDVRMLKALALFSFMERLDSIADSVPNYRSRSKNGSR